MDLLSESREELIKNELHLSNLLDVLLDDLLFLV